MRVGIDTGGTFTDVVAEDGRVLKLPSNPAAPHEPVLLGAKLGDELVHSTTVATNALLTRSGGPTVLVTTGGFEDVLEIGRQARPKLYALHPVKAPPLVALRLGVDERMDASGAVLRAPSGLEALRERIAQMNVRSVAICLLHSYANPAHERAVAEALAPLGLPLSLSSDVLPVPREYERASTTAADAYVRPVMAPYLRQIAACGKVSILQSNGGVLALEEAVEHPVRTALSGPAAGVVGALAVARLAGVRDLVTLDMGGTSTDVALVSGGECALTDEAEVAGVTIQLPMLAIHTVGAGGGSIARVDEGGALKVGPRSAGALPGPASYGKGGTLPTVTDANLLLGRLSAAHFPGGLDVDRARAAVGGLDAEGICAVADMLMARAIKAISVERGVDSRELTLVPFGGAGGMHACGVARELGMTRILVPPSPGLLCAYGALQADRVHERVVTLLTTDLNSAQNVREQLELPEGERIFTAHLRYRGQSFDLPVLLDGDLAEKFHAAHQARYGYALRDRQVELVTVRGRAVVRTPPLPPPREADDGGPPRVGQVTSRWDGRDHSTPIYARRRLRQNVAGPALIVEYSATTYLPPGARASVDDAGCLHITP